MKIGILSDSHDNIPNLRAAVDCCNAKGAALLIHCGDLISPFMLPELAKFGGAVHLIYGNNPGDQHLISQRCGTIFPSITLHGPFGVIEAGGRRLAFTHYPEMARGMVTRGLFDVVCCGHNHHYHTEKTDKTLLINAGELLGKDESPGFCILDCSALTVERITVGEPITAEISNRNY